MGVLPAPGHRLLWSMTLALLLSIMGVPLPSMGEMPLPIIGVTTSPPAVWKYMAIGVGTLEPKADMGVPVPPPMWLSKLCTLCGVPAACIDCRDCMLCGVFEEPDARGVLPNAAAPMLVPPVADAWAPLSPQEVAAAACVAREAMLKPLALCSFSSLSSKSCKLSCHRTGGAQNVE